MRRSDELPILRPCVQQCCRLLPRSNRFCALPYQHGKRKNSAFILAAALMVALTVPAHADDGGAGSAAGVIMLCIAGVIFYLVYRQKAAQVTAARAGAIRDLEELNSSGTQIRFTCGPAPSIVLDMGEEVMCHAPTTLVEPRAVRSWSGGYGGPSFRIAKGISFRLGGSGGTSESHDERRPIDTGTLVLTNQRLIFVGSKRTVNVPVQKIIGVDNEGYFDWLRLNFEGRQKAEGFLFDSALQIHYPYHGQTRSAPFHVAWLAAAINEVHLLRQHPDISHRADARSPASNSPHHTAAISGASR